MIEEIKIKAQEMHKLFSKCKIKNLTERAAIDVGDII